MVKQGNNSESGVYTPLSIPGAEFREDVWIDSQSGHIYCWKGQLENVFILVTAPGIMDSVGWFLVKVSD